MYKVLEDDASTPEEHEAGGLLVGFEAVSMDRRRDRVRDATHVPS